MRVCSAVSGTRRALKRALGSADRRDMANEITCPTCSADLPLSGDEKRGDEVYCTVCSATSILRSDATEEDCEADEEY